MNISEKSTIGIIILGFSIASGNAATITQSVSNLDWNDAIWGSPAATPTALNDYETAASANVLRLSANGASSTFGGGSLTVVTGTTALLKNAGTTSTINGSFTLAGGTINHGPNGNASSDLTATLAANNFLVTSSSIINIGNAAGNLTITSALSGTGDLSFTAANSQIVDVVSFAGISSYSGAIALGTSGALSLDFGTTSYAFSNSLTIFDTSVLQVNSGQTLTFNQGDLTDPLNGAVPVGTYTGGDLTALGSNYANNGGTIVVVPEPSVALLSALGFFALTRRRRN